MRATKSIIYDLGNSTLSAAKTKVKKISHFIPKFRSEVTPEPYIKYQKEMQAAFVAKL